MKVAIATIYDNSNYGNRLQNYALQQTLEKMGCEVETLVKKRKDKPAKSERVRRFRLFSEENIKLKKYGSLKSVKNDYDYFVVGSDQIWNPYARYSLRFKFLKFADKDKRIAYAPSIGLSKLSIIFRPFYRSGFKGIEKISVREVAGGKIVENLLGGAKKIPVCLDPTMLLKKEDWENFAGNDRELSRYLLTYFLGKKRKYYQKIEEIANLKGLKTIHLNDKNYNDYFAKNPNEFVNLIKNAEIICTDSFHGAVFSILLEKPFVVFERDDIMKNTNSRLETLLEKLGLKDRKVDFVNEKNYFEIDFSTAKEKLEVERKQSLAFLESALKTGV